MGRDIYIFIEKRKAGGTKWECVATDEQLMEGYSFYRSSTLFDLLSHNCREGKSGVFQHPLKDWVTTLSPETNHYLFNRLEKPIKDIPPLFDKKDFDHESLLKSLDADAISPNEAKKWIKTGYSFLLTEDIVSEPDACYWNWCTAFDLEWAVKTRCEQVGCPLDENDDYLRLAEFMRKTEEEGCEVRMVYSYDFSTSWLDEEDDEEDEEANENAEESEEDNYLLMYILQNRADEAIEFIKNDKHHCFMGLLTIYQFAYANKLLLGDTKWGDDFLPIVEKGREENRRILEYIESLIKIPPEFEEIFAKTLKRFAWYTEDETFDWMLDGDLEDLMAKGYREIDCLLYEAGLKFNFKRVKELLSQGANPYAHISGDFTSEEAAKLKTYDDVYSLYSDAYTHACDAGSLYGICYCWETGIQKKDIKVNDDLIRTLFHGAGCQWVVDIIREYTGESDN